MFAPRLPVEYHAHVDDQVEEEKKEENEARHVGERARELDERDEADGVGEPRREQNAQRLQAERVELERVVVSIDGYAEERAQPRVHHEAHVVAVVLVAGTLAQEEAVIVPLQDARVASEAMMRSYLLLLLIWNSR